MARRIHNRLAIERFITFYDNIFPSSAGSMFNLEEFQNEPESSPPLPDSDRVWDFVEDAQNQRTGRLLVPVWRKMKEEKQAFFHIAGLVAGWSKPLQLEETDHAALRRWRAKETLQDKYRADLFERMLSWAEERLEDKHPGVRIEFRIPRKDEPVASKIHARNQDNNDVKRWTKEDRYRVLGPAILDIAKREQCTVEAAIGLYRDTLEKNKEPDVSPATCYRAVAFCRQERGEVA